MPRTAKKTIFRCDQHNFILRPKNDNCYYSQAFSASFCLTQNEKGKSKKKKVQNIQCLDCPAFNNDNNFATPTFILCSEKDYYKEKGAKMKEEHQKKMFDYSDQKSELNVPKPRSKNSFCSVCRQNYEDYLEHIQGMRHKQKINRSLFNSYILEISDKFSHLNISRGVQSFNCQGPQMSTAYDEQIQIIQRNPRKKVKCEQNVNSRQYEVLQPPSFYKSGYIPPPPHLTNYNYNNGFSFPYQGMGYHQQHYSPFSHPSNMTNHSQILPQQNGFGQFPSHLGHPNANHFNQPNNPNNVSFNYNMNFFMNPYSFPMLPQNGLPVYNPFMEMPKYYGNPQNYNPTFSGNRLLNQNMGLIPDTGIVHRANKPSFIDLDGQNAVI